MHKRSIVTGFRWRKVPYEMVRPKKYKYAEERKQVFFHNSVRIIFIQLYYFAATTSYPTPKQLSENFYTIFFPLLN